MTASATTTAPLERDPGTLLVVCPSWIGDTIMATPLLRAARAACPQTRIVAALRPGLDEVLRGAPWIDEMIPVSMKGLAGPVRAARVFARHRPGAGLLLPNSFRSALVLRLARIPVRVGYDRDGRGPLLTHRLAVPRSTAPTPMIDYYDGLAAFAFGRAVEDRRPALVVTPEDETAAAPLLAGVDGPFVLLNPGANKPAKRWPAARFAAVADALAERHGLPAVVSGAPGERELVSAVVRAARRPIVDLAARGVHLGALKAVIRRAALLLTNDTGPRHLAAALGTPLVTLFGPTDHRWTTLECPHERIVVAEPFLPETLVADRVPRACAIDRIPVADVLFAAEALLGAARGSGPPFPG